MRHNACKMGFATGAMLLLALGLFALEPAALKNRTDRDGKRGVRKGAESSACVLFRVSGKVESHKAHRYHGSDFSAVVSDDAISGTKVRARLADACAAFDPDRLGVGNSRERSPPVA